MLENYIESRYHRRLYAAKGLTRAAVDVTLIDRRNFHRFQPRLYLVGFQNHVLVLVQWTFNYFTHNRSARLITNAEAEKVRHRETAV